MTIETEIISAKVDGTRGWAVKWGRPRRRFRQVALFGTLAHAQEFAAGLHAGTDAQTLLLRIWGLGRPVAHADMGRAGGAARAASLTPERRKEIGQKAIAARWARVRAAQAVEAGTAEEAK